MASSKASASSSKSSSQWVPVLFVGLVAFISVGARFYVDPATLSAADANLKTAISSLNSKIPDRLATFLSSVGLPSINLPGKSDKLRSGSLAEPKSEVCSCGKPPESEGSENGEGSSCCCRFSSVDRLNQEELLPLLAQLVRTPFFRYFKVNLWGECPFWQEDGQCILRDCSVCECEEEEVPLPWREEDEKPAMEGSCTAEGPESVVDRSLDKSSFTRWSTADNPWTAENEAKCETIYVNLLLNPERYTGYAGPPAARIWDAIYQENCFIHDDGDGDPDTVVDTCTERKVFYNLVSGTHTSISLHIAGEYLLDVKQGIWGKNVSLYWDRVGRWPDRQENLYFTFLFVTQAVIRASDLLASARYYTGNQEEDDKTAALMRRLVKGSPLEAVCPAPFDQAALWSGADGPELKTQLHSRFKNITAIMDCVGCEKCRLWGKLQLLGLATSLKILISLDDEPIVQVDPSAANTAAAAAAGTGNTGGVAGGGCESGNNLDSEGEEVLCVPKGKKGLQLNRNEVIALFNYWHRLSESLRLNQVLGKEAINQGLHLTHPPFSMSANSLTVQSASKGIAS